MKHIKLFEAFTLGSVNEDFNSQKIKFIGQGYDEKIVNRYLDDFKDLRDKKFKEAKNANIEGLKVPSGESRFNIDNYKTFKEIELIVDYVAGLRNFGSANFEDIEVNGDPIYKDATVEIYYADSPRACIQYKGDKPYSWCIARNSGNMFWNYRLSELEPSFYFIKRIEATKKEFTFWNLGKSIFNGEFRDKWHFFVLQVLNNPDLYNEDEEGEEAKKYMISSAMNDGDNRALWSEILKIAPELKGKEQLFVSKPLTPGEREKIEKYKEGISDEEFVKLPFKEKKYYISIYVNLDNRLSDIQFYNLPDDLKNDYLTLGVGLSQKQFESIKGDSKLLKRYIDVTIKKFESFKKDPAGGLHFIFNELEIILLKYKDIDDFKSSKEYANLVADLIVHNKELSKEQKEYLKNEVLNRISKSNNIDTLKKLLNHTTQKLNAQVLYTDGRVSSEEGEFLKVINKDVVNRVSKIITSLKPEELTHHLINNLIDSLDDAKPLIYKLLKPEILEKVGYLSFITYSNPRHKEYNNLVVDLIVSNKELLDLIRPVDIRALQRYSSDPDGFIMKVKSEKPELLENYDYRITFN